jgi:hypothetical protein
MRPIDETALDLGTDQALLYRFSGRLDPQPVGLVPEGLRITIGFDGEVEGGELARHGFLGARVWGIDHLLLRADGVGVIDAPKTVAAGDRRFYEHVQAYCLPPEGLELPPLPALLEPGFEWPDVDFPIVGFSTFRTGVPGLERLNRAVARIDGWGNFAARRVAIETRVLRHRAPAVEPRRAAA